MSDDRQIWDRIRQGDAQAFGEFYRQNAPRLEAFLRHVVGDQQAAEDIMQETFTQIWSRPNGFQPERGALRAYLFGIGRKRAAEWWRTQGPKGSVVEDDAIRALAETAAVIDDAFRRLPEEQRSLLWLREVEGQSYAELAESLDVPIGTVRSRLFAAREALRKLMETPTARVEGGCMKCDEAAEFVSALCDGETISREAAQHIDGCATCRARLLEYAEMGAELRRVSSLPLAEEEKARRWQKTQSVTPNWWRKGWSTMRIPTFAFALMLVAIIALASSLTLVKVRAHSQGAVLMLTAETASGRTMRCAFSLEDENSTPFASVQMVNGVPELYGLRTISRDGERIELGVRAKRGSDLPSSTSAVDQLPETRYWFQPGEKLHVDVQGSTPMVISGELLDHLPPFLTTMGEQLDPNPDELRFVEPVLVRGKEVLHDFGGVTVSGAGKGEGIELYAPHDGRYEISLSPLRSASEGLVRGSRISFTLNGRPYEVLTGAPVARAARVWILYLPSDKSANAADDDHGSAAYVPMNQYLATPLD